MVTAREVIIGMLSLAITLLSLLLGLAFRYGKVVNEVKNLGEDIKQAVAQNQNTAENLNRHILWHLGQNPRNRKD